MNNLEILDLDDLVKDFEDEEDDSELRVKATVTKIISSLKIVEALTKKHGIYKLSIDDIVGASNFKPMELTGALIVIILGPLKKNQRRRDFLRAEISEDWKGPSTPINEEIVPGSNPVLIKDEAIDNAIINLKKFYRWSIKDQQESTRQISQLMDEVENADSNPAKVAIISDHLTLASQSFSGMQENDDDSIEELITSTRCSSAFSQKVVSSVDYDKDPEIPEYRKSDLKDLKEDTFEEKLKMMQDMMPTDQDSVADMKNILNLSDEPKILNSGEKVFDLPTSRQTIKANASSYTVESSAEIQIDMMYWQKMLHWLTVHHFDHHKNLAKDHAKWVVIVWELAGITPTNLKSEILVHQQTVPNFCTRLAEMLEMKKAKIPFWSNLSISNIIHATLNYLLSKNFPADSVPKCMSRLFATVPYTNPKSGSVFQMRGYVDKYISDEKGLLMSPKGYVVFNSYSIIGKKSDGEEILTVPIGTHVLFNAVKVEESIDDCGKKYKYFVATNVWIEPDFQIYYDDLGEYS